MHPNQKPPQLPPNSLQRAIFTETKKAVLSGHVVFPTLIEAAQQKAQDWLNANPQADLVQIETFHTNTSAWTTVWYR